MRGETARLSIPSSRAINFNPLPSYEERLDEADHLYGWDVFQSTPLMRGETQNQVAALQGMTFQSDPLMRGETTAIDRLRAFEPFQSTPLIRGETILGCQSSFHNFQFQSTPLIRGETKVNQADALTLEISIHSPHTRGDPAAWDSTWINPSFQSTPLTRGETRFGISRRYTGRHFNPLPSCEGRQHKPPKIHPNLRQLTQQNHDTPLFGALQAPFCGAEPYIRGAKRLGKP